MPLVYESGCSPNVETRSGTKGILYSCKACIIFCPCTSSGPFPCFPYFGFLILEGLLCHAYFMFWNSMGVSMKFHGDNLDSTY